MTGLFTKRLIKLPLLVLTILMANALPVSEAQADACTYREAIMALGKGNAMRGFALMRMASRDGDRRAEHYLLKQEFVAKLPTMEQTVSPLKTASISHD